MRTAVGATDPEPEYRPPALPQVSVTSSSGHAVYYPVEPADTAITAEQAEQVARIPACDHCGGRHMRKCPRVRLFKWHPNGSLAAVEFWPDGEWSDAHVLWPDELDTE